jgi:membrane protein implicated in regulation of membrane protease activity
MMRRYRLWMGWTIGPLTAALIVLTVLAAATGFMPWPPLLAAAVAAAVAGTILIALGPRVARQQERERHAQRNQRVR